MRRGGARSVAGLVLAAAVVIAACERRATSVTVSELAGAPRSFIGRVVSVRGVVVAGSLRQTGTRDAPSYELRIAGDGSEVRASYEGIAPDTLYEGNEGLFEGTMAPSVLGWELRVRRASLRTGRRPHFTPAAARGGAHLTPAAARPSP